MFHIFGYYSLWHRPKRANSDCHFDADKEKATHLLKKTATMAFFYQKFNVNFCIKAMACKLLLCL